MEIDIIFHLNSDSALPALILYLNGRCAHQLFGLSEVVKVSHGRDVSIADLIPRAVEARLVSLKALTDRRIAVEQSRPQKQGLVSKALGLHRLRSEAEAESDVSVDRDDRCFTSQHIRRYV
jgi:hypothetical protein